MHKGICLNAILVSLNLTTWWLPETDSYLEQGPAMMVPTVP